MGRRVFLLTRPRWVPILRGEFVQERTRGAPLVLQPEEGDMKQLAEAWSGWMFGPMLSYNTMMAGFLDWQRENAEAFGRLLSSLYAIDLNGHGAVGGKPRHSDLYVGKTLSQTKTMTDSATLCFGFLSGDFNPLHFNEALAKRTRFEGRIAHGFHTASMFSGVLAELCPWCVYLRQEMEFTAPVRPGDRITAVGVVEDIDEKGVLTVGLLCRNERDQVVVRGKAILKKLKEVYQ
jgi:3-hydroxybutyryl-CoA dehydratase